MEKTVKDNGKKTVMLHYTQFGKQRSPNMQFDILRNNEYLQQNFDFVTLNQDPLPSEIGHIKSIQMLKAEIKKVKPDIIHIVGVKEGFHCVIAALLAGCKKRILITHGFAGYTSVISAKQRFFYRWIIEPITLLLSTKVQCNSQFSKSLQMIRLFAKNKSTVIYNFLKPFELSADRAWRKSRNIREEDFLVATIGNMHSGKGYDLLEKVIEHYKGDDNIKFVVMGDGRLKADFDKRNCTSAENPQVYSLGNVPHSEAMKILSEADVFYLPTRFETLGMVFAEAGFCGIPSIGTDVGAVGEFVQDGKTGFLLQPEDFETAIEKIDLLRKNRDLCAHMGEEAKEHVHKMLSMQEVAERIEDLYNA